MTFKIPSPCRKPTSSPAQISPREVSFSKLKKERAGVRFKPWSLCLAVFGHWRCACWWLHPFWPWRAAAACVWAGAGTWGKPVARPPWRCRRISVQTEEHSWLDVPSLLTHKHTHTGSRLLERWRTMGQWWIAGGGERWKWRGDGMIMLVSVWMHNTSIITKVISLWQISPCLLLPGCCMIYWCILFSLRFKSCITVWPIKQPPTLQTRSKLWDFQLCNGEASQRMIVILLFLLRNN